jgi:hypothetical protein
MTIKTHGRMMTSDTIGITQLDLQDGTANQAIVTDGQGVLRFATVGAGGSVGSSVYVEDIRTGDGSTVTFTLSTAAPYEESILVFIDGVAQPTSSFTLPSTTSITFSPAPGNGAAIRICHLGIASSVADCSITGAKICMGGDTTGDILFYNGTAYQRLVIGTAGQHLATNAAVNAPEWVDAATASLPAVGASGNVLTSDASIWSSQPAIGGVGSELVSHQLLVTVGTTAVQTYTKPAGVTRIRVYVQGAGGASKGDGGPSAGAAGGGGCAVKIQDVTNVTTVAYNVGWSGTNFSPGSNAGATASGWDSTGLSAGNYILSGGPGGSTNSNGVVPGTAGTASGGDINISGTSGGGGTTGNSGGGSAGGPFGGLGHGAAASVSGSSRVGTNGYIYVEEYKEGTGTGKLVKVWHVNTTDRFITSTNFGNAFPDGSIPQSTEGIAILNLPITASATGNKLLFHFHTMAGTTSTPTGMFALFRTTGPSASANALFATAGHVNSAAYASWHTVEAALTTTASNYQVRLARGNSGNVTINDYNEYFAYNTPPHVVGKFGAASKCSLTVLEYTP